MVKRIYVSPHLDDVALSCGGHIVTHSRSKDETIVLNVFNSEGAPRGRPRDAKAFSQTRDYIGPLRSMEDRAAWNYLGISPQYVGLPEAILRNEFPFLFSIKPKAYPIIDEIYREICRIVTLHPGSELYFPAGVGNHIDHVLCREVAFKLLDDGKLQKILLYEDVPYAWLKFVRNVYYKILFRNANVVGRGGDVAFRVEGLNIRSFLNPGRGLFPRGKFLFLTLYFALTARNLLNALLDMDKKYTCCIGMTRLEDHVVEKKINLIKFYESQLDLLFGNNPDECLRAERELFSTEVLIEIVRAS
jgi:LmbE family N-acetylglucosaminyl deacetylase